MYCFAILRVVSVDRAKSSESLHQCNGIVVLSIGRGSGMSDASKAMKVDIRRLKWDFSSEGNRYWFGGSPALTHLLNVYTLLVPDNEAFYIRTINQYMEAIDDETLRSQVMHFCRQESLHGVAHRAYWRCLEERGINIARFVNAVNWVLYRVMEPIEPKGLRLSIVAAIEHVNALLGNIFLKNQLLDSADSELRRLFVWHFSEEIEHKAVAHEVLERFHPGYLPRVLGALIAVPMFYFLLFVGTIYLLGQERELLKWRNIRDLYWLFVTKGVMRESISHLLRYFRRGFQPWEVDDSNLVVLPEMLDKIAEVAAVRTGTTG